MNELTLGGKTYVSSKRAAEITGYAKDYIGQLCREGRVQAQLVGRNWYILESSIREHRFGSEESTQNDATEVKNTRSSTNLGWESPRYASEEPKMIPIVEVQAKIDAMFSKAPEVAMAQEEPKRSWGDVQSAWQEWFSKKEETMPKEEPILQLEAEVDQSEEADEERVAITTIYEHGEVLDLSKSSNLEQESHREEIIENEEVIEEERVSIKVKTRSNSNARIALIVLILVVVAITLIGSGLATKYYPELQSRLPELNILQGITVINK